MLADDGRLWRARALLQRIGRLLRHNELRNEFAFLCTELNMRVDFEQGPANSLVRPADVLVHGLGTPTAVDFSVMHALQPSVALADVQPGKAARQMERAAICRRMGWAFVPFVAEAAGTLGGKARHLL